MAGKPTFRDHRAYFSKRSIRALAGTFDKANTFSWLGYAGLWTVVTGFGFNMLNPQTIGDYLLVTGGALFATWVAIFLWRWVFSAPAEMDYEAQHQLKKLIPRLRLSFTKQDGVKRIGFGGVSETYGGTVQTVNNKSETIFRLTCTNESARRCDGCRAFLMDVMAVSDDNSLIPVGFDETVPLSWSRVESKPVFDISLEPNMPRAVYVLARRMNPQLVLYRDFQGLPLEYTQLFRDHKKFRLWIQVNGPDDAADTMCLDVWPIEGTSMGERPWSMGVEIISAHTAAPLA